MQPAIARAIEHVINERTTPDAQGLEADVACIMQRDVAYAQRVAGTVDRYFRLGDMTALFRFIGTDAEGPMTRAIEHLACDVVETPDLTTWVWDTSSTGITLSPILQYLNDTSGDSILSPRQEVPHFTTDRLRMTTQGWDGKITIYDPVAREAWIWIDDPAQLPLWDFGAPFRTVLNWWVADTGRHCIHAGAVGTPEGAVVLTGKGGSGKSTSSLACIGSSLRYISDDYCVLSLDDEPQVLSLYNTGKLRDDTDLARQPRFRDWIINHDRTREDKFLMYVHEQAPEAVLLKAPLRAVVLPTVTAGLPKLTKASAAGALAALAPTSLFQLPGAGAEAFATMASLVRKVPCYRLDTGSDVDAIPPLLAALLGELNARNTPESLEG